MQIEEFTVDDSAVVEEVVRLAREAEAADAPWSHPSTVANFSRHAAPRLGRRDPPLVRGT